jgi:two-component system response regulator YesN
LISEGQNYRLAPATWEFLALVDPNASDMKMDRRIQKVVALIDAEQSNAAKLSDLARAVNLSVWHLSHLFRREIHTSITDYRRRRRLARAGQLLQSTFLSIKEIMATMAVNDRSHFTREFKKTYGLSPTQYRQNNGISKTNGA